jgi:hypothetical protein
LYNVYSRYVDGGERGDGGEEGRQQQLTGMRLMSKRGAAAAAANQPIITIIIAIDTLEQRESE